MRRLIATALAVVTGTALLAVTQAPAPAAAGRLTNLAHLDFLGAAVTPPSQGRHTTYRLAQEPGLGVLWTYADHQDDGTFKRVGGGAYDDSTNTYGQGAYNADDIARAAVVYLRDWRQTGAGSSRRHAYALLRGLTYLQTTSGPDAGNVVLWMQPDGTLNRSATPAELPDPSDSDASYWLARTVWALGEAYPAFRSADPGFAAFVKQRLDLAIGALDREVLDRYGRYQTVDGRRTPRWLIADGADASAEAVLGLASYVRSGGTPAARRALRELSDGVARLSGGSASAWPFGGVLPWALSRSYWHAWGSQMPAALAEAGRVLGDDRLQRTSARDSFTFDPWMLTSGGTDNGRIPARIDANQIAYGADARVQSLFAAHTAVGDQLAGLTAAWFFGANASGAPAYDPATGVTVDGIAADGTVNHNSGAESTIHGLLTMLALDAHPAAARIARTAHVADTLEPTTLQAEDATLTGGASAVVPESTWTGESQYAGTGYARLPAGSKVAFAVPHHPDALLMPIVDLRHGSTAQTRYTSAGAAVGRVRTGAIGPSGTSPAPGALLPVTLGHVVPAGSSPVVATASGGGTTRLDALIVQPLVTHVVLSGGGHGTALLRSAATVARSATVTVPGGGRATATSYDGTGHLVYTTRTSAADVTVDVPPGGFVLVRR